MASFRSRVRHFRAPVVVTLALGAVPACSGETAGQAEGDDTTGNSVCPAAVPTYGTSCDYDGPGCSYPCAHLGGAASASCADGKWIVTGAGLCDAPETTTTTCPASAPQNDTYCDYVGPSCGYGPSCGPGPLTTASCVGHNWSVVSMACNPPPPACPVVAPVIGAPCSAPVWFGPDCVYAMPCGTLQTRCYGNEWVDNSPPNAGASSDAGLIDPGCGPDPVDAGPVPTDAPGDAGAANSSG